MEQPEVIIRRNNEPTDLNYGGFDVMVRLEDDTYSCVAETKDGRLVKILAHVAATTRSVLLGSTEKEENGSTQVSNDEILRA